MKTKKMSLANIQGKLSRAEMKNIMAGCGGTGSCNCNNQDECGGNTPCCVACSGGPKAGVCHSDCA